MKGIIFTDFLEMVEESYSLHTVSQIIKNTSNSFEVNSFNNYNSIELSDLVANLSKVTSMNVSEILYKYGQYLFNTFIRNHPDTNIEFNNSFEILRNIENIICFEVRKHYYSAYNPVFSFIQYDDETLVMIYESEKKLGDVVEGVIKACIVYFNENVTINRDNLNSGYSSTRFVLKNNTDFLPN